MEVLSGMAREPLCGFHERETKRKGRRNTGELNEKEKKKERRRERKRERESKGNEKRQGENGSSRSDIMGDLNTTKRDAS